ncbi:GNAT domain-containing protein [Achaetomium macrosporum]|uniref:GNAT domain-containing protein n=1 Tax=Achaetomium macrosporum TaxID=79813 RepID=A0AAN7C9S5_9PEZI|nr:GNAT domain-containing protein [Achaetomium macrosporum]
MSQLPAESRPPPGPAPDKSSFVKVRTTLPKLPFPPLSARQPIVTPRLIIRPATRDDFPAIHVLRTQPEVMRWTARGRPDRDLEETMAKNEEGMGLKNPGNTFNFVICDRETGELIGLGGCHNLRSSLGWPEVGYMLRKEYWGKGLGSEFLQGWLRGWEGLERAVVEWEVDPRTLVGDDEAGDGKDGLVRERLIALTAAGNDRSQGVLGKNGFEWFLTWLGDDISEGAAPGAKVVLPTYRYFSAAKKEREEDS